MKNRNKLLCYLNIFTVLFYSIFSIVCFPLEAKALTSGQNELIENVGRYAQSHYEKYKILPSFVVAQALQESAVATSSHSSGISSLARLYHNYFGMKVGPGYNGASVNLKTGEQTPAGSTYYVNSDFRAYDTFEEGMEGYYEFIYGYSRYHNIIGVTDYKTVCTLIRQDGWATDIQYSQGLISKIESFNLTRFDIPEVLVVDPNWQVPATVTPNITSGSIPVFDIYGNQESDRYIDYNDECYIEEVYTNGLVHVKYPSTAEPSGYRWAYAKLDEFTLQKKDKPAVDNSWNVPVTVTPKIESGSIPVYDMFGNAESNRYIDYNDECYIDEVYTNGLVHVKYPSVAEASGYRWAYAKLDDFPLSKKGNKPDVDTDWEVPATLTPNITSGSIPVCDIQGNTEANRYIDYNDECYIDEVYTNGLVHVKYPSIAEESGYRWAYAKLEYFSLKKKDDLLAYVTNYGDDFSAIILNADSSSKPWKPIMRDGDNVVLGTESSTNYDCTLWHFIRHSDDGTYTIYSYKDGKALDVDGSGETYDNGVNVQAWESNGTINQKWYLIKLSDGTFRLRPKCADKVMDVNGAYVEDGTNLQIWESNHTSAQCFAVYPMNGERDVLNYTIKAEKTSIAIGKTDKITISGDIPYVYNYKFHIVDPSGKETTKDNGCNPVYQFSATVPGEYTVFAEVKNPLYSQTGSLTEKSVKITVDCEHSYTEKIVAPTCTSKGYTLHTCSICGESYKDHETEMIAHDYQGKITKEPTYDEEGVRTFTCSVCGDKYTEAIPKLQKDISEDTSEPDTGIETTPTETSTTEPVTPKRTPGDVNDDGQVNLKDVVLLSRFIAGGMGVSINESAADVNGDNLINLKDVVLIRRYIVGGWNVTLK